MASQAKVHRAKATKALTKAEAAVLGRLDTVKSADRQAEHAHDNHFQSHRGAIVRAGVCVVFGNDGFSTDVRSQRELVRVVGGVEEMGHEVEGFGLGGEGYTWALTIRPGSKADREVREEVAFLLDLLV